MTGLLNECKSHFHCSSLYEVLGVERGCKPADLRKAFYKMSLLHHPDRHDGSAKTEATKQFQVLSKAYSILSDEDKRKIYDDTGVVDEDDSITSKSYEDWVDYWQLIFPRVTTKQIDEYCNKYRGSDQERTDLANIYERCQGDMDIILETMLFASYDDEKRLKQLIDDLIKEGRVKPYSKYTNEPPDKTAKRAKRAHKEQQLFIREQKKRMKTCYGSVSGAAEDDSLISAIMASRERHQKAAENLIDKLTEKYCKPPAKGKRVSNQPRK